ncbi:MAG: hypothetical protein ACFFDF_11485 [Candidatus Odinarchaeota archaeon]
MPIKKTHSKLEQLINSLTIKEQQKTFLRGKINEFYNEIRNISQYQMPIWSNIYLSVNQYILERFWYNNSFDRGIFIKNRFDIDLYFVYSKDMLQNTTDLNNNDWNNYPNEQNRITGDFLFELLYSNLKSFNYYHRMEMKLLKDPPYGHAIPIRLDYPGISILFDCIPAIELSKGYLVIPNGLGGTKKINPNLEEKAFSKINRKQSGKIIKFILLIKYWNFTWGKPIKGYILERLAECIFDKIEIHTWNGAMKTFFNQAIHILDKKKKLPDRVYNQYSILNEYSNKDIEGALKILGEAASYAQKEKWKEIVDDF